MKENVVTSAKGCPDSNLSDLLESIYIIHHIALICDHLLCYRIRNFVILLTADSHLNLTLKSKTR